MSYRLLVLTLAPLVGLSLHPIRASADKASATVCAAKLSKDARTIYDASAPGVAAASDLKQLVTQQTRFLAMAGRIDRGGARAAAEAAGACLKMRAS